MFNRINLQKSESYVDSPEWLKNKKAAINPNNKKDNKWFKYALSVALNHKQIKNNPERLSNLKPFMRQYEWKNIDFPATSKDWKKFEQDTKAIALNILFVPYKTK